MEDKQHTRKKIRTSDEMGVDRLTHLPDSVIHHILSLMDAKHAVQTCILSKKWKFQWAHIPSYTFNSSTSSSTDFVAHLLSNRKLFNVSRPMFRVNGITMLSLVKLFCHYVLLCRIEELDVRRKVQINDQMVVDRLSSLPDSIINHILSLMETKYAVQTCVLSKKWRNHWTNVHNLNFDHSSFNTWVGFKEFVLNVLKHRQSFDLRKLKFICGETVRVRFVERVLDYAKSHGLQELDTDALGDLHRNFANCQPSNYRKEKAFNYLELENYFFGFRALTTLQISSLLPDQVDVFSFDDHSTLENLILVKCDLSFGTFCSLYASRLVTLTISDFSSCENISIDAPRLKFFNWKGESPCLFSFDKSSELEEVNIHISPSPDFEMKTWFMEMRKMVEGCCPAKFIRVSLNISEGKFELRYSSVDAETKVVELNKESGEKRHLYTLPMINGFDPHQFATTLGGMIEGKKAQISNHMEIDRLSSLPDEIVYHVLSFMDTKYAVQTSVLSKIWRYRWTHIYSLNLECRSKRVTNFKNFVLDVLNHRKPSNLNRLRFHLRGAKSQPLMRMISSYAISRRLEELDTDLTTFLSSFYQCQTLRTLKLGSCSSNLPDLSSLTSLTTLELTNVMLYDCDFISRCLNLEKLSIIECDVMVSTTFNIFAPQLVKLMMSNFKPWKRNSNERFVRTASREVKIVITAPRLKFFSLKEVDPLVLSLDDCPTLEKVDIHICHPVCQSDDMKQTFILDMFRMVKGLFHVKSLRISLNFTKEKFVLYQNDVDEEAKIAVLNKDTGVQQLVGLAVILEEI